jgi:fructose-1,6-bisphosphatase/inositol monophosphatase family enzyme
MTPSELLDLFEKTVVAVRDALAGMAGAELRARTEKPGQYALDLVADKAALGILGQAPVAIVSEESGITGPRDTGLTVVLDPVDGSSNAARQIPYWATSLCAVDERGPVAALVINQATGVRNTAIRGEGARRDGVTLSASTATRVEDSVVAISSFPGRMLAWKQFRALGSAALALCDVASGAFDGYLDGHSWHAPWDYLGGLLVCQEAGAQVVDANGRPLAVADPTARRQLVAAGTPALLQTLLSASG